MRIVGVDVPGRTWCDPRPDGVAYGNLHVGVQRRREVVDVFRCEGGDVTWDLDVDVVGTSDEIDFKGPYVQGKRGERFLYLSWGAVDGDGEFRMFRRAKLMLAAVDPETVEAGNRPGHRLVGTVGLTGGDGGPRCAAVRPPVIEWAATPAS